MPLEPVIVEYCPMCSVPLEFCEYAGCKRAAAEKGIEELSVAGRCKLDPGLKARLVSKVQPNEEKPWFQLEPGNLVLSV